MAPSTTFPACHVVFPDAGRVRSAAFYLAAEEFLAREMPADNYVYFWQLRPTCVFGRNQDPSVELDIDFCNAHGVELVRRKSGGGAIFADEDNIMVSLVTGGGTVEKVFNTFSQEIARSLSRLGAPMKVSGRNDICLVDGRKICGGAFYHLPNRNIVHCTMLYDTNMPLMQGCLTPARAKLESKGVKSVPSRIGLLKEYFDFGVQELRRRLADQLTNRSVLLTKEQVRSIEEIEKAYHEPTYIYGKPRTAEAKPALILSRRIEGCGKLDMYIYMSDGHISDLRLDGDFFETGESSALEAFRSAFIGQPFDRTALQAAIAHHHPERSIRGLEREKLLELLTTQASSQI